MSETVIIGSMELWRQNAKEIERGARDDVNELIREEIERVEEAEAVIKEKEDGFGDHGDDDAEDEDFGGEHEKEEEHEEFEMDDGRRLEVEAREEATEEETKIAEPEEGQQIPGVDEIRAITSKQKQM
jgi:hypothetical protein